MTDKLPRTLPVPPDSASGAIALDRIMDALRRTIPDRPARSLHRIAIGLSTLVVGNDEVVCRVPLNHEAATAQERLSGLLPFLARRLPGSIPNPVRTIPATDGLPFGAFVLRRLPTSLAPPGLLPRHDHDRVDREICGTALPVFTAAAPDEADKAMAWWDACFAARDRRTSQPVIVHGDFWHENILVDPSGVRVTGILDWENCGIGDPAMDLAPLWHANPTLFTAVLRRYARLTGNDPAALRQRTRWQFGRREWAGLAWAVRLGERAKVPDALAKVRAVLAGAADGM